MARLALVCVPYFLSPKHREFAEAMVASVQSVHDVDRIAVINELRSADDEGWIRKTFSHVIRNDRNNLARAWNIGIREALARGADGVVVSNMDVVFHPRCLDNLYECMCQEWDAIVWSAMPWHNPITFARAELRGECIGGVSWGCFMVNSRLFTELGEFDEGYHPAYREDSDMHYRLGLRALRTAQCRAALYLDKNRGTIKGLFACERGDVEASARRLLDLRLSITRNDERYARKWGGWGGQETFVEPFNGKAEE